MASLKLNGLNKVFPSGEAGLYDVNLEAQDKEFLVVVGGDNSGKSTLLRVVAGLEEATDGEIFIDGKEVSDVDPKDRDIAMIFRSSTLYPALNVFDNMAFGLKLRKAPQALIDRRVKVAAEILGLTDVLYRKPKALTSAARQRVAIGRAIVREPKLYLFDEPLSGLDENLRADILNVIINLQARMNGTFLYATKNLSEALTIGTRIVVMKEGFVQQIDTPANLYDYPANAYVAFYIGSPAINFIKDCKIVKTESGFAAVCGGKQFAITEKIAARFKNADEYAESGKEVILGIRPEDAACTKTAEGEYVFAVTVGKIESVGETVYAECDLGDNVSVVCPVQKELFKGESAVCKIDLNRLYIFDGETRLTLLSRDEGYAKTTFADADFTPLSYTEECEITEKLNPNGKAPKKKLR